MSLETNYKKTPKKVVFYKMQLHCDCIAFFLFPLYLLSAQRNRWQAWGLKQKKNKQLKKQKQIEDGILLSQPSAHGTPRAPPSLRSVV